MKFLIPQQETMTSGWQKIWQNCQCNTLFVYFHLHTNNKTEIFSTLIPEICRIKMFTKKI